MITFESISASEAEPCQKHVPRVYKDFRVPVSGAGILYFRLTDTETGQTWVEHLVYSKFDEAVKAMEAIVAFRNERIARAKEKQ